jgi:23S rRNA (uracil1939-C5)-methyltransferase
MDAPVSVTIRGIAAGGAGVADLPDGRVVFVPRTAPGDRARIRIRKSRPRWAEGSLFELLEPAAERRAPLCALYDRCGGCQLQHLPYAQQLVWKGRAVADALQRIGGLGEIEPPEVVASPRETGYRSRVTLTLLRLGGDRVVAGFHALDRPTHVIDVAGECVLPRLELVEAWRALRRAWGEGAARLPAARRLRLTLRAQADGVALVVDGGPRGWRAEGLIAAVPALAAVWHLDEEATGAPVLVAGTASGAGGPRGPAFEQVNPEAAALLVEHVLGLASVALPKQGASRAVDAYSGDGPYARGLVARGWKVTGIELDRSACAAARDRAREAGLVGFEILEGAVEDRLDEALPTDLLVVNPPRAGLLPDVVRMIAEHRPPYVVYVSCDPATLARDLAGLRERYELSSIRCFDLFPQTAHVETVVALAGRGR